MNRSVKWVKQQKASDEYCLSENDFIFPATFATDYYDFSCNGCLSYGHHILAYPKA